MNNSPYRGEIPIDEPMICITEHIVNKVKQYGLTIRFYAGDDSGDHMVFANGRSCDNKGVFKSISFNEFIAVTRYSDVSSKDLIYNLNNIINTFKVKDHGW